MAIAKATGSPENRSIKKTKIKTGIDIYPLLPDAILRV
jgi:hypothetical protein